MCGAWGVLAVLVAASVLAAPTASAQSEVRDPIPFRAFYSLADGASYAVAEPCAGGRASGFDLRASYYHDLGAKSCAHLSLRPPLDLPVHAVLVRVEGEFLPAGAPSVSRPYNLTLVLRFDLMDAQDRVIASVDLAGGAVEPFGGPIRFTASGVLRAPGGAQGAYVRLVPESHDAGSDLALAVSPHELFAMQFTVVELRHFGPVFHSDPTEARTTRTASGRFVETVQHRLDVPAGFRPVAGADCALIFPVPAGLRIADIEDADGRPLESSSWSEVETGFLDAGPQTIIRLPPADGASADFTLTIFHESPADLDAVGVVMILLPAAPLAFAYAFLRRRTEHGHLLHRSTVPAGAFVTLLVLGVLGWASTFAFAPVRQWWPLSTEAGAMAVLLVLGSAAVVLGALVLRGREVRDLEGAVVTSRLAEGEMRQRAEDLETLAQSLSHDLKAPLITLDWLSRDLEEELRQVGSAEGRETLERIRRSVGGMERLVGDLMTLVQAEHGRVHRTRVDIAPLVREVIEGLQPLAKASTTRLEEGPLPADVATDPALLRQVLHNLIHNAIKYGRGAAGRVVVHGATTPAGLVLHVDDDGPGVPAEHRERIFGLLQRNPADKRGIQGTGVGLALVRRIVERLGGTVVAAESPLGGARFTVRLAARHEPDA